MVPNSGFGTRHEWRADCEGPGHTRLSGSLSRVFRNSHPRTGILFKSDLPGFNQERYCQVNPHQTLREESHYHEWE